jgi:DNA anti-recombination protein RmuC
MMRIRCVSVGFVAGALFVTSCDSSNSAAKKAEEGAKKAASEAKELAKKAASEVKEGAKEAADAAKLAVLKPVEEALPKIEEKIKGLSGESATKAQEKFDEFKKLLGEFKSAAPEKWQSLKDGLMKSFEELTKLVGIEK